MGQTEDAYLPDFAHFLSKLESRLDLDLSYWSKKKK